MAEHLEHLVGAAITPTLIAELSKRIVSAEISFVGLTETAQLLNVFRQLVSQLKASDQFPEAAGATIAGTLWLEDDIVRFQESRQATVDKHMGIPQHYKNTVDQ